ncbi:MAG: hypothetical protein AAF909_10320 [Pseudomonadota bacterium]
MFDQMFDQNFWSGLAGWVIAGGAALFVLFALRLILRMWRASARRARLIRGPRPKGPIVFLNARMGVAPAIMGPTRPTPEGYRLACLFFGAGLIDRTGVLDHGFDAALLDPAPDAPERGDPARKKEMATLLSERAAELRRLSETRRAPVRLFWSGGIDSTAAACALLDAFIDAPRRLEIVHTAASEREYPLFYKRYVVTHPTHRRVANIRSALAGDAILCTGEHGDQLFGSLKARRLRWSALQAPWERSLPPILARQLGGGTRADAMLRYLEPQIRACPIPLPRLFDLLWWWNFSMKWQAVSLRLFADGTEASWAARDRAAHFYRSEAFQLWSLSHPDERIKGNWKTYKWPLKEAIRAFTRDDRYFARKEKEPSLRGGLGARDPAHKGLALAVTADGGFYFREFDDSLRSDGGEGGGFSFSYSGERRLWRDLEDDGE